MSNTDLTIDQRIKKEKTRLSKFYKDMATDKRKDAREGQTSFLQAPPLNELIAPALHTDYAHLYYPLEISRNGGYKRYKTINSRNEEI